MIVGSYYAIFADHVRWVFYILLRLCMHAGRSVLSSTYCLGEARLLVLNVYSCFCFKPPFNPHRSAQKKITIELEYIVLWLDEMNLERGYGNYNLPTIFDIVNHHYSLFSCVVPVTQGLWLIYDTWKLWYRVGTKRTVTFTPS